MSPIAARVLELLEAYVSSINARSLFQRAVGGAGLDAARLDAQSLRTILPALERTVRLFIDDDAHARLVPALWALANGTSQGRGPATASSPVAARIHIASEEDVSKARIAARSLCQDAGAPSLAAQKIATAVSELARNILKYASKGTVDIELHGVPRRCLVRASDSGPGIKNLDDIFAGRYRSKTGMGLGLLGAKRMSDRFEIHTGAAGTVIALEVNL